MDHIFLSYSYLSTWFIYFLLQFSSDHSQSDSNWLIGDKRAVQHSTQAGLHKRSKGGLKFFMNISLTASKICAKVWYVEMVVLIFVAFAGLHKCFKRGSQIIMNIMRALCDVKIVLLAVWLSEHCSQGRPARAFRIGVCFEYICIYAYICIYVHMCIPPLHFMWRYLHWSSTIIQVCQNIKEEECKDRLVKRWAT